MIYQNDKNSSKIKINLITKDTKIFMNNKTEKIKTVTLN